MNQKRFSPPPPLPPEPPIWPAVLRLVLFVLFLCAYGAGLVPDWILMAGAILLVLWLLPGALPRD